MKILLILASFMISVVNVYCSELYSDDENNINIDTKTKVTYYYQRTNLSDRSDKGVDLTRTFERQEVKNYTDIQLSEYFKISSTVGYYKNGGEYNKETDLGEIWLSQDRSNVFVEKLYGQLLLMKYDEWKLSFAYGIIPLTGGNFKKYSNQDEIQGNGLFTLIDLNLQGGFFILSNDKDIFKVGKLFWKKDNFQHDEKLIEKNDGTDGTFVFYEHKEGKHTIELDYITANVKYDGYDIGNAQMYGVGYSYDDSLDTGFVYYGVGAYSVWNSEFLDVLNSGYFGKATNSIKYANKKFPEQYDFDNDTQKGTSILLGTKYYTEVFNREFDIGVEYFKTSKFNNGSLFYNDYGFWRRRGTDMYTIYADYRLIKGLKASIKYSFANNEYTAKNGSIADTTSTPQINNFYKKEQSVLFKISYEF